MYDIWCSQRPGEIIVLIEEIHGRPIKLGGSFSAIHTVGYFDSIPEMHVIYERYKGNTRLSVDPQGWRRDPKLKSACRLTVDESASCTQGSFHSANFLSFTDRIMRHAWLASN